MKERRGGKERKETKRKGEETVNREEVKKRKEEETVNREEGRSEEKKKRKRSRNE